MKKLAGYILSFYILFSTTVLCSIFDSCEDEQQTEQASNHKKKECMDCSPFCSCSHPSGFTGYNTDMEVGPWLFYNQSAYNEFYISPKSDYYSSFFQPPRFS